MGIGFAESRPMTLLGTALLGGGARAAYQVGVLTWLADHLPGVGKALVSGILGFSGRTTRYFTPCKVLARDARWPPCCSFHSTVTKIAIMDGRQDSPERAAFASADAEGPPRPQSSASGRKLPRPR